MKLNRMLVLVFSICLIMAVPAGAESLQEALTTCFPPAPSGYAALEMDFQVPLGKTSEQQFKNGLMKHFEEGREISREYEGDQIITISLIGGKRANSFKYAVNGETPGCEPKKIGGIKGAIFYEDNFVVVVADKVAVYFEPDEWSDQKDDVFALVKKFDYKKLATLIK